VPKPAYTRRIRVRLRDLDGLGHVNHVVYLTYLEVARTEYVFSLNGGRRVTDFDFILARMEADYRSQASLGDEVDVELWPTRIGTKSWDLAYRIVQSDSREVVLEASTVLVSYDFRDDRTIPVPEPFRTRLAEDVAAAHEDREARGDRS
jgi:acyl-CoA thioester hydrolase